MSFLELKIKQAREYSVLEVIPYSVSVMKECMYVFSYFS